MNNQTDSHQFPSGTLHVGRPNIGNRDEFFRRLNDMLDRRWLTNNGPFVQELEEKIATHLGVKHCIAVCNGTMALEIAIKALDMTGKVILPSFTFIGTAHALQWLGIKPVFCDIDPKTHNLDPEKVEALITDHTNGILGVHLWGRPCAPEALFDIAKRYNLTLLFDAAHAFECSHLGRMIGTFGDAEILSFHATKFFNTAEGGAIVTQNDELAEKARRMRDFGFEGYDNVVSLGINGKMNELCAALGLVNLERLNDFVEANKRNYEQYREGLFGIPGLSLVEFSSHEKNNFQYVVVLVDENKTRVKRDDIVNILHDNGVLARRYFWPCCHRMEPYRSKGSHASERLPETERIAGQVIILPTGTSVTSSNINRICAIIRQALNTP